MIALLLADLRNRWRSTAAFAGGCFALILVLAGTYTAIGGFSGFEQNFGGSSASHLFSAFSGSAGGDIFTPSHYLAFGFGHPLFFVLALGVSVSAGVAAVAADVESGRAELVFTAPVRRTAVFDTRFGGWALMELLVLVVAVVAAWLGIQLSSGLAHVSLWAPVRCAVQFAPLAFFVAAMSFTTSAFSRTRGQALGVAVGLTAGAYLANLVALLWHPLAFVRRVDPFGYFSPTQAADSLRWGDIAVLLVAGTVVYSVGRWHLERRDLT